MNDPTSPDARKDATMTERTSWNELRDSRMNEPGAREAYEAARLAFELGAAVRRLREDKGWSQTRLAREAGMTQPAVARFEAGGTIPTLTVLQRLAHALDANLVVRVEPAPAVPDRPEHRPAQAGRGGRGATLEE